jgi:NAD(P)H-flavin reductase
MAPLRSLLLALFNDVKKYKKIHLKYGARTPEDLVYHKQMEKWKDKADVELSVDRCDARWKGKVCVVTGLLDGFKTDLKNSVAIVCGPPIMMKFTTFKLVEFGYKPEQIYLSMEKNMSCGFGKCGHCRVGTYYACKDGPVFTYDKIKDFEGIWD